MPSGKPSVVSPGLPVSARPAPLRRFVSPKTAVVLVAALGAVFALWLSRQLEPRVVGWAQAWAAAFPQPTIVLDVPVSPNAGVEIGWEEAAEESEPMAGPAPSGSARKKRPPRPASAATVVPSGVRISAAAVLRLANARAMPGTRLVPARPPRPPGLELSGVSRLGLGVQDGDVLVDVAGTPVTSISTVVSLVMQVRARHAPSIGGTLWRGAHSFPLQVEMPYVAAPGAGARTPAPSAPAQPAE